MHSQIDAYISKLSITTPNRLAHFLAICELQSAGSNACIKQDKNYIDSSNNLIIDNFDEDKENLDPRLTNVITNLIISCFNNTFGRSYADIHNRLMATACIWSEKSANTIADLGIGKEAIDKIGQVFSYGHDTFQMRQELVNSYYSIMAFNAYL